MNKILSIAFILAIVLVLSEASKLRQQIITWNCEYSSLQYKSKGYSLRYVCTSSDSESEKVRSIVYFGSCKNTPKYLSEKNSSCKLSGQTIRCNEGSVNISSLTKFSKKKRQVICPRRKKGE